VCPWNGRAPFTNDPDFAGPAISLEALAQLTPEEFRMRFGHTPVARAKHAGILRNAAVALANRAS